MNIKTITSSYLFTEDGNIYEHKNYHRLRESHIFICTPSIAYDTKNIVSIDTIILYTDGTTSTNITEYRIIQIVYDCYILMLTNDGRVLCNDTLVLVPDRIIYIACKYEYALFLTYDGRVYSYNSNRYILIPDIENIVHIECGRYHAILLDAYGYVYILMYNGYIIGLNIRDNIVDCKYIDMYYGIFLSVSGTVYIDTKPILHDIMNICQYNDMYITRKNTVIKMIGYEIYDIKYIF